MNQIKYITSGGLAFSENKDMEKLRRYSLKGRHVFDFSFMGYSLERGKKSDYIYSIDYRWLKEDEKKEYLTSSRLLDGHMLTQKGTYICFVHNPVQNRSILTATLRLKNIEVQVA